MDSEILEYLPVLDKSDGLVAIATRILSYTNKK